MAESVGNLMLKRPRHRRSTLDGAERRLDEPAGRQTETHSAVLTPWRDQVDDAETVARV